MDYVVDIAFEEPQKLKFIPEITQFTQNIFKIYVLDKNNMWQEYIKSNKYYAIAIKIVIEMVNQEGVISHMQINNIYNELRKFILQNNAHIRQSDYSTALTTIQNQIKYAAEVKLDLELFLILKEKISYTTLNSFFLHHGLIEQNGQYLFIDNNITSFSISDEYHRGLAHDLSYNLLLINSPLHLSSNPNQVIDKIFDLTEKFMHQFESRLLTTNRQSFTSNDYNHLLRHISNYITNAKKYNLELGGALLHRIH